jgi:ribonuclease HI
MIESHAHSRHRFPKGERVFTDGSLNDSGGIGAAYYDESTDSTTKITVGMGEGILRAELIAILKIIQDKQGVDSVLRVFTDSLLSIRLISRWIYFSHELGHTDNKHWQTGEDAQSYTR